MSAFEGSYKSLLQGVSQQVARERLEGQVSSQDNMLSDVVTNIRRRPGAECRYYESITGIDSASLLGWDSDVGGVKAKFLLNLKDGVVRIYNDDYVLQATLPAKTYLVSTNRRTIKATTVADRFVLANTAIMPTLGTPIADKDPLKNGFFYVRSGAFSKEYNVTISNATGTYTYTMTTPDSSGSGAAAASTPEAIATNLANQINAATGTTNLSASRVGSYVYVVSTTTNMKIVSTSGTTYLMASNQSYVQEESDLPARLPADADGIIISVGSLKEPTYFRYEYNRSAWLEVGKANSPSSLENMPLHIQHTTVGGWAYATTAYEGRYAGDDVSSPPPNFITRGITGIGSFQGRLVILSGNLVNLSASNKPYRFWRSSVTAVLASDPIEVGSSANSSAAYEYCIPFQKDLLLFSEKYQALIPGGNQAITPSSATVVVTSTYESDMTSGPIALGRTLMYPAPRSQDFFGVMEMVPSQYTDSQYVSDDVTAHLPKYLPGRCRFAVSSSVAGMVLFASTRDFRTLVVHEYLWSNMDKVQQAWHKWTFPYDIADAFFSGSDITLIFVNNGTFLIGTVDPRIGTLTAQSDRRPYLDLYTSATVANQQVTIAPSLLAIDPNVYQKIKLSDKDMDLMGEEVGFERPTSPASVLTTVPSFTDGPITMGIPYRSGFSPSPPNVKDSNGVVISSNKLTILRFMVGTANTSEYEAIVADSASDTQDEQELPALYWGSSELDLGMARVNTDSVALLPCRTNAATTTMVLYTEGLGELNLLSLEYVCRYNQKLRRR